MKSQSIEDELGHFEVRLPINADGFRKRVSERLKKVKLIAKEDFFDSLNSIDYGLVEVRQDKVYVHKQRKMFTSNDSIGTGFIEISLENRDEYSIAKGKISIDAPHPALMLLGVPFVAIGLYVVIAFELWVGIVFSLLGIAVPAYTILIQRDYYINLRKYAMNFFKDVMKES